MINVKFYKENGELKKCTTQEFYSLIKNIKNVATKIYDDWNTTKSEYITEIYLQHLPKKTTRYTIVYNTDYGIISQLFIDDIMNLED